MSLEYCLLALENIIDLAREEGLDIQSSSKTLLLGDGLTGGLGGLAGGDARITVLIISFCVIVAFMIWTYSYEKIEYWLSDRGHYDMCIQMAKEKFGSSYNLEIGPYLRTVASKCTPGSSLWPTKYCKDAPELQQCNKFVTEHWAHKVAPYVYPVARTLQFLLSLGGVGITAGILQGATNTIAYFARKRKPTSTEIRTILDQNALLIKKLQDQKYLAPPKSRAQSRAQSRSRRMIQDGPLQGGSRFVKVLIVFFVFLISAGAFLPAAPSAAPRFITSATPTPFPMQVLNAPSAMPRPSPSAEPTDLQTFESRYEFTKLYFQSIFEAILTPEKIRSFHVDAFGTFWSFLKGIVTVESIVYARKEILGLLVSMFTLYFAYRTQMTQNRMANQNALTTRALEMVAQTLVAKVPQEVPMSMERESLAKIATDLQPVIQDAVEDAIGDEALVSIYNAIAERLILGDDGGAHDLLVEYFPDANVRIQKTRKIYGLIDREYIDPTDL